MDRTMSGATGAEQGGGERVLDDDRPLSTETVRPRYKHGTSNGHGLKHGNNRTCKPIIGVDFESTIIRGKDDGGVPVEASSGRDCDRT